MKLNPYTMARIFLIAIAVLIAVCFMTACGGMKKVITKDKTEEKTETEIKTVTTTANTETTAATRTIVETFTNEVTVPAQTVSVNLDNKYLNKGDTIHGDLNGFIIKEYLNETGKRILDIKTKEKKVNVPGTKTTVENVSTVKTATATKKEDVKLSTEKKVENYTKEKEREPAVNWTIVIIVFGFLIILVYLGWRFWKKLPK